VTIELAGRSPIAVMYRRPIEIFVHRDNCWCPIDGERTFSQSCCVRACLSALAAVHLPHPLTLTDGQSNVT